MIEFESEMWKVCLNLLHVFEILKIILCFNYLFLNSLMSLNMLNKYENVYNCVMFLLPRLLSFPKISF